MKKLFILVSVLFLATPFLWAAGGEDCATATVIGALPYTDANATNCANADDGIDYACTSYDGGFDVYYVYTNNTGSDFLALIAFIDNTGGEWHGVAVFEGNPCVSELCLDNMGASTLNSSLAICFENGKTYYILVDNWPSPDCGLDYTLTVTNTGVCPTSTVTPPWGETFIGGYPPAFWTEATGQPDAALTVGSSLWAQDTFANAKDGTCPKVNIWNLSQDEWAVTPEVQLGAAGHPYHLQFDVAVTVFAGTTLSTLGSDDRLAVYWSTVADNFPSANLLYEATAADGAAWPVAIDIDLDVAGVSGNVFFGFFGDSGLVDDAEDNDVFFDDVQVFDPLYVDLRDFSASIFKNKVLLTWETAAEIDIIGFNIVRQNILKDGSLGRAVQLNKNVIPAEGSASSVASYEFVDSSAKAGATYRYTLESIEINSDTRDLGTVDIMVKTR